MNIQCKQPAGQWLNENKMEPLIKYSLELAQMKSRCTINHSLSDKDVFKYNRDAHTYTYIYDIPCINYVINHRYAYI